MVVPVTHPVVKCRSCQSDIVWLRTEAGKNMPVDAASVVAEDTVFVYGRHISHFATCPNAKQHRKPRNALPPR